LNHRWLTSRLYRAAFWFLRLYREQAITLNVSGFKQYAEEARKRCSYRYYFVQPLLVRARCKWYRWALNYSLSNLDLGGPPVLL